MRHKLIYDNLKYNSSILNDEMPKEQAFCGLIKPLLDNFDTGFVGYLLLKDIFIDTLKHFYLGYPTGYSLAFNIE